MQPATAPLCAHCGQPLPQHVAAVAAAPPRPILDPEARRATHDGFIWPVDRPLMADFARIRERMAEDMAGLIAERGEEAVITTRDLERLGWTRSQVLTHAEAAVRLGEELRRDRMGEAA